MLYYASRPRAGPDQMEEHHVSDDPLSEILHLSHDLADPSLDYVILGEGNTSARADATSFWVKASGQELRTITESGFVRVAFDRVLRLLTASDISDAAVKQALSAAKVDPAAPGHPSVETLLHALCLNLKDVNYVGHTHPTVVNALTCSVAFETAFAGRLFPDEIVVCGPAPLLVPYTDPGVPLARKVQQLLDAYIAAHNEVPKTIVMQNHGLIALGKTAQQVENITAMAVKAARVLLGTYAAGGPHFLSAQAAQRIHTRPDELYRRQTLKVT
jgi:rhamnose utilization protein RhaD (predicted bifunctional aldolase and dehydrogenase)